MPQSAAVCYGSAVSSNSAYLSDPAARYSKKASAAERYSADLERVKDGDNRATRREGATKSLAARFDEMRA